MGAILVGAQASAVCVHTVARTRLNGAMGGKRVFRLPQQPGQAGVDGVEGARPSPIDMLRKWWWCRPHPLTNHLPVPGLTDGDGRP